MYESVVKQRWSKVDQENLQSKVEGWRRESPEDLIEFHPYAHVLTSSGLNERDKDADTEVVVELNGDSEGLSVVLCFKARPATKNKTLYPLRVPYGTPLLLHRNPKSAIWHCCSCQVPTNQKHCYSGSFVARAP